MARYNKGEQQNQGGGCGIFFVLLILFLIGSAEDLINNFTGKTPIPVVRTKNGPAHDYSVLRSYIHGQSDEALIEQFKTGRLRGIIFPPYDRYLLHLASELDRAGLIRQLMTLDQDINQRDAEKNTPLHIALKSKSPAAAAVLRELGADLLAENVHKQTILHFACQHGNIDIAKAAIKAGANVNAMQVGNWAPIHYACSSGNTGIVVLLAENGADISAPMGYGWTPGDIAFDKHQTVAAFLQSRNASFNKAHLIKNYNLVDGWPFFSPTQIKELPRNNPVFNAMVNDSPAELEELANNGFSIDISNQAKTPILCLAIIHRCFIAAEYLMNKVSNADAADANGKNALIYAIESGNKALTRQLINKTSSISHLDNAGNTALHYAIARCDNDIAAILIDKGADIFAKNNFSRGMMHTATENDNEVMFASLIANGCDVNQEDVHGNTPLHLAVLKDNSRLVQGLLKNGADFAWLNNKRQNPLMLARSGEVRQILENRFEIEGTNPAQRAVPAEVQIVPTTITSPGTYEKE